MGKCVQRRQFPRCAVSYEIHAGQSLNRDDDAGNEADYVIVSVVRSSAPGFLTSSRRANVMLTRCKRGMVIVSSINFLQGVARKTLVGRLAECWREVHGRETTWVGWKDVLRGTARLPGASMKSVLTPGSITSMTSASVTPAVQRASDGPLSTTKPHNGSREVAVPQAPSGWRSRSVTTPSSGTNLVWRRTPTAP
jgi:hypothetical protein